MQRILFRAGLIAGWGWFLMSLAGCGGDLGTASGVVTRAVTLRVGWDSLTSGPGSTNPTRSAIVTLRHANPNGSDIVFGMVRPSNTTGAATQNYSAPTNVAVGKWEILVQFFAGSQPSGAVKQKIDTQVAVQSNGMTTVPIALGANPANLAIVPGQSIVVGNTISCLYQVTDVTGDLVPIEPGEVACALQNGAANLGVSGTSLTGLASGMATVVATLQGTSLQSAPATISVTAP